MLKIIFLLSTSLFSAQWYVCKGKVKELQINSKGAISASGNMIDLEVSFLTDDKGDVVKFVKKEPNIIPGGIISNNILRRSYYSKSPYKISYILNFSLNEMIIRNDRAVMYGWSRGKEDLICKKGGKPDVVKAD